MAKLEAPAVAKLLVEYGRLVALSGGNPFRARAFTRAAESLAALTEPLGRVIAGGRLTELRGIGNAIAAIITTMHETGTYKALERMRAELPAGVVEMLSIPGLRPDQAIRLHEKLNISNVAQLEAAANADRIKATKGLGAALQRKVLQGLEIRKHAAGARHMHRAAELIAAAEDRLQRSNDRYTRILPAGDLRRGNELVADLAVVAEVPRLDGEPQVSRAGELSVHVTDTKRFGITLLRATGSARHIGQLRALAEEEGMTLDRDGLRRGRKIVASRSEEDIYDALGLSYIAPELREGSDEIELARDHRLPTLIEAEDIRGILHTHTEASDGVATLAEMAEATRERGYEYIGITDHSKSAHYAGGLSTTEVEAQGSEIDRLNRSIGRGFRIFKGIECDILTDGSLDYDDAVLRKFDLVIASVHSHFRMDRAEQTERIVRAVQSPFVHVLGHMTGRQLLRRHGYAIDVEKVLAACAKSGVAVEINANPWRLDIEWRWHRRAAELGCLFAINPDAHSTPEIDNVRWGVAMARKGGLSPDRVVNTLPRKEFERWLRKRGNKTGR
jgi:DNA polymerase (family 10)